MLISSISITVINSIISIIIIIIVMYIYIYIYMHIYIYIERERESYYLTLHCIMLYYIQLVAYMIC